MRWVWRVALLLFVGVAVTFLSHESCACGPRKTEFGRLLEKAAAAVGIDYEAPLHMP